MKPFENIFGNNAELRTIEFMLPLEGLEYNAIELAKEVDVSVATMERVVSKLASWGILSVTKHPEIDSRPLRHTNYSINLESPLVKAIIDFDNEIIVELLNREGITDYKMVKGHRVVEINVDSAFKVAKEKWKDANGPN